jgi:hypothetical protein
MTWKPTLAQLETIADMSHARAPVAAMARAVGLSPEAFIDWRQRCMMALSTAFEEAIANPEPKPVVAAPVSPRIVAERAFERPDEEGLGTQTI